MVQWCRRSWVRICVGPAGDWKLLLQPSSFKIVTFFEKVKTARRGIGPDFHMMYPRCNGVRNTVSLAPAAPTAIRLWETLFLPFTGHEEY